MLLTDEDIGNEDMYVLNNLYNDGWEVFCDTQRGYKRAVSFMQEFYPEYKRLEYKHRQYTLKEVASFVDSTHRHHNSSQGCNFAFGVKLGNEFIGVITAGRPVAPYYNGTNTLEITRVCVKPGYKNLCSYLYSHMIKIAKDLNYDRVITYTLENETGASCKAAGFEFCRKSRGGTWNCKSRPRKTKAPACPKKLWLYSLAASGAN